jgi:HPt (histidine-containing phosphotransfer) domain-containing protein
MNREIFDRDEFDELVMGNEALAQRILHTFLDDMPLQLARLAQAVNDGDPAQVRLVAHSMKGAAAAVSGGELREVCHKLEQDAKDGDLTGAATAVRQVSSSLQRTVSQMESYVRE